MPTTEQFTVTLPQNMANLIRRKVASGEYETESEVIRDGIRTQVARDQAINDWLKEKIGVNFDILLSDPGRPISIMDLRSNLSDQPDVQKRWPRPEKVD